MTQLKIMKMPAPMVSKTQRFIWLFALVVLLMNGRFFLQAGNENKILLTLSHVLAAEAPAQSPSVEHLLQSASQAQKSPTLNRGAGLLLATKGNENDFDSYWSGTNLPETELLHWGEMARHNQQFSVAIDWYQRALRANPNWGDPWYYTGIIYEEWNQKEEAFTAYERATQATTFSQIGQGDVYVKLARLHESSGESRLATEYYEKAFATNDFSGIFAKILTLNGVAVSLMRKGDYQSAIELLSEAKFAYPSYEWSYIRLGRAYLACCNNFTLATENIEEALELNPNNKWGFLTAGDIYAANGQTLLARQMYQRSLEIDPALEAAQHALNKLDE